MTSRSSYEIGDEVAYRARGETEWRAGEIADVSGDTMLIAEPSGWEGSYSVPDVEVLVVNRWKPDPRPLRRCRICAGFLVEPGTAHQECAEKEAGR